ncbi:MAG: hypothetical protein A2234_03870 [Elusimicrobia bacterium RIFOXYA2_FULL_58_8]|nr:MAG: hypothetical protein A2285_02150 [Elusimicrobia bacterium RIFOXYA12_FULL_57_11]OGS13534.1 MAG: hypothetical protein A2234_03870 [Elusimicrobia bacterium RIFOXYA2_FULL_58_8]
MIRILSVSVFLAVAGCQTVFAGAAVSVELGGPLCRGCNIILISLDALQAAHVHSLGYPRSTTPALDALARQGSLFTQAISAASWTLPATMAWFTGAYPSRHKVVNKFSAFDSERQVVANLQKLSPGMKTITETLKAGGYCTGGFTGDAGVNGVFGFKAGFDVYFDSVPAFSGFELSIPRAVEWLKTVKDGKFFLFLHGYNNHGQYMPTGGFDRRYAAPAYAGPYNGSPSQQGELREKGLTSSPPELSAGDVDFWRAIYDEKIARTDALLEGFINKTRKLLPAGKTIFVIASDHGTEVYEHGRMDHGATLYEEVVRVPLVLVVPGLKAGVVASQVSTVSLMPTLLELVGIEPGEALKEQMEGPSLLPLLTGKADAAGDVFMETDYRLYTHKRGVRTADGWKFILTLETGEAELFNLREDPAEKTDLAGVKPEIAAALRKKVAVHFAGPEGSLGPEGTGCNPVYADQCRP